MEPERLRQVEELYHAALELDKNRRADFLRAVCGADEPLRQEIESLLAYRTKAADFIESPAMELEAEALARDDHEMEATPWMPASIGRYRVLRVLGEGGMGVVYEAEQEQPRRTVALKVIKPGMASSEVLRRFEQESLALARLQHPGIAQIYEAGTADTGLGPQPYFAMERIHGPALLDYAEAHRLNTRQRLELIVKICEAVQHAHQRGLIHRDLKPGNILVDETGQPKILDFGVARVTDSDAQATRQTDLGQLVGTLAYMSPEQVLADPLELDTRSDVYALGVILYELLAGRLPYTLSRQPHEAALTIREADPTPLSSISRLYRGDIETIAAKALEKDKTRRYASAAGVAADIQRHLNDEPIAARPPGASYQLKKFARRHKALVAGVAAVFAVLIAGIVASAWEATRARRAEQIAEAVNEFLQNDLLAQASASVQARPDTKPDPELKVRTVLDRAAARIEAKFKGQPLVEASIRQTMGKAYVDLGLYPEAQRQFERALDLRRGSLGEQNPNTIDTMHNLSILYTQQGKFPLAEPLGARVLEVRLKVLGKEHADTVEAMNGLAQLYWHQGKYEQAEQLFTQVIEVKRRLLGEENRSTLGAIGDLALVYYDQGRYAQAEPLYIRVLELKRRVLGEEHPETLSGMNNLALLYEDEGKNGLAEPLYTRVLEIKRRVLGKEHPSTLTTMNNLAALYKVQNKYAQAELLFTEVLDTRRRVLGDEHDATLRSINNLAIVYGDRGKFVQAELLLTKALELNRRVLGDEHPDTLSFMNSLGSVYLDHGKLAQAEPLLTKVLGSRRRVIGEEHPGTLQTMNKLAQLYRTQGKYQQAESLYTKVLEVRRRVLGPQHPDTSSVLVSVGGTRLLQQRYSDAEPPLREALTTYKQTNADTWLRYNSQSMLGASLAGQKQYAGAEPLLLSGYQGMKQREAAIPAFERIELEYAGQSIVRLYQDWGKPKQVAEWRERLRVTKASPAPAKP